VTIHLQSNYIFISKRFRLYTARHCCFTQYALAQMIITSVIVKAARTPIPRSSFVDNCRCASYDMKHISFEVCELDMYRNLQNKFIFINAVGVQ
jgi:hypothetical protein